MSKVRMRMAVAMNLRGSSFLLRGWVTVRKIAEVKRRVLDQREKH
jgi:hypothetical protein